MSLANLALVVVGLLAGPPAPPPDRVKQLSALDIYEYPAAPPALPAHALEASALQSGDIAEDFSNLADLAWLEPVAKRNKVFFVGEAHYSRGIHELAHRMLFALNTFDHYGLISLEHPYSDGLFLDHFLQLRDDARAEQFLAEESPDLTLDRETLSLVRAIRRWNKIHPQKPIRIAAHDIEHDWQGALGRVVVPYLCATGGPCDLDVAIIPFGDRRTRVRELKKLVMATGPVGAGHAFLTRDQVLIVLSNLEALMKLDQSNDQRHRQEAIVRNLTDAGRLGRFLRTGKVMLWGGSHHATTRYTRPNGENILREGSYFNHDFPATRGRAYSVLVWSLAFSFADVNGADVSRCVSSDYRENVRRFQTALARGLVSVSGSYRLGRDFDAFDRLIMTKAAKAEQRPMRIERIDWKRLLAEAKGDERDTFEAWRDQLGRHDGWLVVPRSPIVTQLCATPPAKAAPR